MAFIIDKQTLNDLNIFGKVRGSSIYGLFNVASTRGGATVLEEMFRYPLSDRGRIDSRTAVFRYFMESGAGFTFVHDWFDAIEHYLADRDERTLLHPERDNLKQKLRRRIGGDTEFEQIHKGVCSAGRLLRAVRDFLMQDGLKQSPYGNEAHEMQCLIDTPALKRMVDMPDKKRLSYRQTAECDKLVRFEGYEAMRKLLRLLYALDVYITVARVAKARGFHFATTCDSEENVLHIEDFRHPLLEGAVPNSIHVDRHHNVVFLTGANMAGKSTFMKAFGVMVYLAHMGFPLSAQKMEFSVQDGMYTTINLPDSMNLGYSHFYAEVQRLKKVAIRVGKGERLVIVFDELFRGTNVKDAHEGTVEVMKAFAEKNNCIFMISTHITEAGADLCACGNVNFAYMPTEMRDGKPVYPYKLKEGITSDRHGMMIVNNERIIDILKSGL